MNKILLFVFCSMLLTNCSKESDSRVNERELDDLYKNCIERVLEDDLWSPRDCYDTGHRLMLPMHYAFKINNSTYISYFKKHFMRFYSYYKNSPDEFNSQSYLNRIQYLYLCSWFCALYVDVAEDEDLCKLIDLLEYKTSTMYHTYPGNWGILGFTCMRENIDFIINKQNHREKYYASISDNILYTLAAFSNITYVKNKLGKPVIHFSSNEIEGYAYKVFTSEVVWNKEGGWVLQPGVCSDHPDFYYAGSEDTPPQKKIVDDLGEDVSHFHRMPLWLKSFLLGTNNIEYKKYYNSLLDGLIIQLNTYCIVPPSKSVPYYRFNNFMSGHNGWYRYKETTGRGYAPYELSLIIVAGWYSFLESFGSMYEYTLSRYPFDELGESIYNDPVTTRERNPILISEDYRKLLLLLNVKISK